MLESIHEMSNIEKNRGPDRQGCTSEETECKPNTRDQTRDQSMDVGKQVQLHEGSQAMYLESHCANSKLVVRYKRASHS